MKLFCRSFFVAMIVLSIIVGLSCCIDNSDALDYESNKINFNPDEVRVVRSSVELEPLTTISSGEKIYVYEKTGYTNYKINGNDTDKDNFIVSAALRDSGVVITTEKKSYRIDFNTDDTYGTTPPSQIGITIGSITTIPEASFSKTGYTMIGWNTSSIGNGVDIEPGQLTLTTSIIETCFGDNDAITLYPVWSAKTYSVSLSTERGTIAEGLWVKNGDSYKHDYTIESETFQMPSVESDDRFYDFICWEDQNGNTVSSIAKGSSGDLALHAVWALREYTMNININGRMVSQRCTLDSVLEDPECEEGFQFVGWFFKDQEGKETEFTSMSQMSEGMSIYAVFEPIKDDPVTMAASAIIMVAFFSAVMFFSFRKR